MIARFEYPVTIRARVDTPVAIGNQAEDDIAVQIGAGNPGAAVITGSEDAPTTCPCIDLTKGRNGETIDKCVGESAYDFRP